MSAKKSRQPVIELLTGSLIPAARSSGAEVSPTQRSPRGLRNFDSGGVGLGIVAYLEKAADGELPALLRRNPTPSSPIPVASPKGAWARVDDAESLDEEEEDYTIVTCRLPNRSYTKVYHDGRRGGDRSPFRIQNGGRRSSVFHIGSVRSADAAGAPSADFLSACHWCQKNLQDEDIYMYRGEKAFCSSECRYRQIVVDERTDKCSSEASRSVDVSSSPYTNGQIFTTGILAI